MRLVSIAAAGLLAAGLNASSHAQTVVEYYNASLDHYFMTHDSSEIDALDRGATIKGWVRTGEALKTYAMPQPGWSPVCRYYIPPSLGDSHFFGRGTAECVSTGMTHPDFSLEDPSFMSMMLRRAGFQPPLIVGVLRLRAVTRVTSTVGSGTGGP